MKIRVEVTGDELAEMSCDTPHELEELLQYQLDNCTDDEGEAGVDWMVGYELEVVKVDG